MWNENDTLHPEIQLEQDIVTLAGDIYKNTNALELSLLDNSDKDFLKVKFNSIFESLSASWEYIVGTWLAELTDNSFISQLKRQLSKDWLKLLGKFLDNIAWLYQKIKTDIQPNETRYAYALGAVLMNAWVLSRNFSAPNITWSSTSFNLKYASEVQEKVKDIIAFNAQ